MSSKSQHHISLFTISREDIYDYVRCPKIVAIKVYRNTRKVSNREKKPIKRKPRISPHRVGLVGEIATEYSLSVPFIKEKDILDRLKTLGIALDKTIQQVLKETLRGLSQIRSYLDQEYGELEVIGKGESRYDLLPSYASPDFVAFTPKGNKPILIEVKNAVRPNYKRDKFQASYYNTLQSTVGVIVQKQRVKGKILKIAPEIFAEKNAETLIIYSRLGECKKVTDTIDLHPKKIKDIWKAKQLGLVGKAPHTNCNIFCPHHRFDVELPEDDLEVAKPLPLIFAKGLLEKGADPDYYFLHNYLRKTVLPLVEATWWFNRGKSAEFEQVQKKILEMMITHFDLDQQAATRMIETLTNRQKFQTWQKPNELLKTMANEVESWEKLLTAKGLKQKAPNVLGITTNIYTLPKESSFYIRKSWKKW